MGKKFVLKSYDIKAFDTTMVELNLPSKVKAKLEENRQLSTRYMRNSELEAADEGDLISAYKLGKGLIFGTFVRIKHGEANQITSTQLEGESIRLDEMESNEEAGIVGILKDYGYFCFNKAHLVLTAGHISRKAVQAYFNWLLTKPDSGDPVCTLEPKVNTADETPLSDVKSIAISEAFFSNKKEYTSVTRAVSLMKNNILFGMLSDTKSLEDIDVENILSATIRLRLKLSSRSKKSEENKKVLAALLQSADSNDIVVSTKGGKKIKGGFFEVKKDVEVDVTSSGFPHEAQLEEAMRIFLRELGAK